MRRRNVKNAHERLLDRTDLAVLEPSSYKGKWHQLFGNQNPICLEIGMGKGKFIMEHARSHPHCNFIGIEKYESVLVQAFTKVERNALPNLKLICVDAEQLTDIFAPGEIAKIFLNFSDPWPKKKHAKRRLTHVHFLDRYQNILQTDGMIEFKTDNRALFEFSIVSINNYHCQMLNLTLDLHHDTIHQPMITTEYEDRFSAMGMPIYYLNFQFEDRV